jgi:hypothetical protein
MGKIEGGLVPPRLILNRPLRYCIIISGGREMTFRKILWSFAGLCGLVTFCVCTGWCPGIIKTLIVYDQLGDLAPMLIRGHINNYISDFYLLFGDLFAISLITTMAYEIAVAYFTWGMIPADYFSE